jgi:hypothetical protein
LKSFIHEKQKGYPLTPNKEYVVCAINIWKGILQYLVTEQSEKGNDFPVWVPTILFEITDPRCPHIWSFAHYPENRDKGLEAILGYPELVDLRNGHYDGVLLGDQEARKLFHIRRIEIEKSVPGEWVQL